MALTLSKWKIWHSVRNHRCLVVAPVARVVYHHVRPRTRESARDANPHKICSNRLSRFTATRSRSLWSSSTIQTRCARLSHSSLQRAPCVASLLSIRAGVLRAQTLPKTAPLSPLVGKSCLAPRARNEWARMRHQERLYHAPLSLTH